MRFSLMYDPYHTAFPKSAPKLKEKESHQHGALSETATLSIRFGTSPIHRKVVTPTFMPLLLKATFFKNDF
jgi:hypothetical protein